VTNTKEKSSRKAKYNIPDIGGPDAAEDQSVTKVVQFLVGGSALGLEVGGAEPFSPPHIPLDSSADVQRGEESTPPPTKKRVSLDHLFNPGAKDQRIVEDIEPRVSEPIDTPQHHAQEHKEEDVRGVTLAEGSIGKTEVLPDRMIVSNAEVTSLAAPESSRDEVLSVNAGPSNQTFDLISGKSDANSFDIFIEAFGRLLKPNLLTICRLIYENTVAIGQEYYPTTVKDLAREVGIKKRFCFVLLSKLEELGFVERSIKNENKKVLGILLRLNVNPFK
jgi:hypothetical protein